MSDDLVKRLRWAADNSDGCGEWNCDPADLDAAADRIEELEAKLAKVISAYRMEALRRRDYTHDAFDRHISELTGEKT